MKDSRDLPTHIGIIMDGNGRWAIARGKTRSQGHLAGSQNLKRLMKYIFQRKIPYLSIYAFSTENFKRDVQEVNYLMNLFVQIFQKEFSFLKKEKIRVIFSGRQVGLPDEVIASMNQLEQDTAFGDRATLNICLNYGGQDEIVDVTKKIAQQVVDQTLSIADITREVIEENLYQSLPPLDFVIRTSGEQRISNFMLWQSAYAEYYFPEVYFPDFNEVEFERALTVYQNRNRRFGGTRDED